MTVTLTFQSTGIVPAQSGPFTMRDGAITLGRSEQNDVALPDPDRIVSGRHCVIEDQGGSIVVVDLSTNGTFLNYSKAPLGPTPTPLNDGDILVIGGYEILIKIDQPAQSPIPAPAPLPPAPSPRTDMADFLDPLSEAGSDGDFLDDLLGGPTSGPAHTLPADAEDAIIGDDFLPPLPEPAPAPQEDHGSALSDMIPTPSASATPAASQIPDDWDLDLDLPGPDRSDPFAAPDLAPATSPTPETVPPSASVPQPEVTATPTAQAAAPQAPASNDPARAFLQALGAGDLNIPDEDLPETMHRLGGVLNKMVAGIREILMTRQSIKSEFRINQTVISAGANNPLKFSVSVDQSIQALTLPAVKGYLPAEAAVTEALDDIKAHEVATITGMEAALKGVLARLDPAQLSERIAADTSLRSVLTNKKARYWDVFEAQYQEISDQAENDFQELFSREFARAYQAQLERLKDQ